MKIQIISVNTTLNGARQYTLFPFIMDAGALFLLSSIYTIPASGVSYKGIKEHKAVSLSI